jgi:hypothetical protein
MPNAYAPGSQAWGRCQRCSMRFLLKDLIFDGYMPGLRVCTECYDPRHPQEFLQDTTDPVGLWQPSPEFGPEGPTLTITAQSPTDILLNWTKAKPEGGPRIRNYTLQRAVSYDGGFTFMPFATIYVAVVQYDSFGALLFDPDHPLDYTPVVPPGTVIIDPYVFDDTTIQANLTYRYQVLAFITHHRNVPSNVVQASTVLPIEFLTSRPYPYDFGDAMRTEFAMEKADAINGHDAMTTGFFFESGSVISLLITYSFYVPEAITIGFAFESGTVLTELITYSFYVPEEISMSWAFESGSVVTELITYSNYIPEALSTGFHFTAGSVV